MKKVVTDSGAHNTIYGPDGRRVYLAGLRSPTPRHRRSEARTPSSAASGRSAARSGRSRSTRRRRCASSTSTTCSGSKSATSSTGKMLHRVKVHRLREGPGEAARLSQPRHRADARREGALAGRRRQQQACTSSTRRSMPPKQIASHRRPRSAGLDHVQPRRPLRLSVDRRGHRHRRRSRSWRRSSDEAGSPFRARRWSRSSSRTASRRRTGDQFGIGRKR